MKGSVGKGDNQQFCRKRVTVLTLLVHLCSIHAKNLTPLRSLTLKLQAFKYNRIT